MRMRTDEYTGEKYDADKWYRGANGCWVNKDAERAHLDAVRKRDDERLSKLNAGRVARGKRRRPPSSFARSASRYAEFLREDGGETFGEWLRLQKNRRIA